MSFDAQDGTVQWARHYATSAQTRAHGVTHDTLGNVALATERCESINGTDWCEGFVSLLAAATGTTLQEVSFGPGISAFGDVVLSTDGMTIYALGTAMGDVDLGALGTMSFSVDFTDVVLVALSAATFQVTWAARIFGNSASSVVSTATLVEAADGYVYAHCGGACEAATSTASADTVAMEALYGGAVVKFHEATGAPVWGADVPSLQGMAIGKNGTVYVTAHSFGGTFGDATFTARGSLDQFVMTSADILFCSFRRVAWLFF